MTDATDATPDPATPSSRPPSVSAASTSTAPPPAARPSLARRILPKLAVSLVLGALFAYLASRGGVPLLPPRESFAHVAWWAVPAYVGMMAVTHFFRASRWRFLVAPIKPVPLREVIALNWIGFFAIYALPLRLGELARPALSKLRLGIPVSAGLGTVAVERVLDGLVASLCVAWAIFALPRRDTGDELARHVPTYGMLALVVFVCALIALAMFLWQRALATRLTRWGFGLVSKKLGDKIAQKVGSVADGVRSIGDARLAAGFLAETIVYWGTNALGMWVLAVGVGLPMTFAVTVAIMGILAIGILLPAGPGLFGTFQLSLSAALKLYFAEAIVGTQGAVFIFLLYVIQASFICVVGIVPLYLMHIRARDVLGDGL